MNFEHKIIPLSALDSLPKTNSKQVVLVGGCFDIFHYGHHVFLQKSRVIGDRLIVLLESDEHIISVKKKQPVHTQQQRSEILASLEYVDLVVLLPYFKNPNEEYRVIVEKIKPQVIAYTTGDLQESRKKEYARMVHGTTYEVPYLSSFSSSQLITYAPIFRD